MAARSRRRLLAPARAALVSAGPARLTLMATRRLHELSIEVLTSYELADIARISEGYDLGLDLRTPIRA